jgi:flavin reductase (DIM6/NTAB) family NADH-FMN oxidoreductase RutF
MSAYHLMNSLVVPRPIAWVSTVNADGVPNLAPHSYFTVASVAPPMIAFVSIREKDTLRNIRISGEFVVNIASRALAEAMNETSVDAPSGVSEFALTGLATEPSSTVAPPRVAAAPGAIECAVEQIIELGDDPSFIVIGRVQMVHVANRVIDPDSGRVDPGLLDAVARLAGSGYSTITDRFSLDRPSWSAADVAPAPTSSTTNPPNPGVTP